MDEIGIIRIVKESDLPLLEWDGEYSHYRRVYREIYNQFLSGKALLWVLELNGKGIIGQIFSQLISKDKTIADGNVRAYIFSFRVKKNYQNQGWGTKLLLNAENVLIERGFNLATLNVSKSNTKAQAFYEHRGYRVIDEDNGEWTFINHRGERQVIVDPSWRMEKLLRIIN